MKELNKIEYQNNPKTIMDRLMSVTTVGECGDATLKGSIRDSLNLLETKGTEMNNTQSQSKRGQYKNDSYENRRKAALKGLENKTKENKSKSLNNLKSCKKHVSKKTKEERSIIAKERSKKLLLSGNEMNRRERISEAMKGKVKTKEHLENIANTKKMWSDEKRDAIFRKSVRNIKISESRKLFLEKNQEFKEKMIEKFINAPKYKKLPNKPEVNVINLGIENLKYTGDGKYFITLGNNKKKNPDFIVIQENKTRTNAVVEIMDFEYWHHKDELKSIPSLYNEKGIQCLIFDAARCYKENDLRLVKKEIENFIAGL